MSLGLGFWDYYRRFCHLVFAVEGLVCVCVRESGGEMLVTEEKEKRKVGERRSAQRIKRVLADTTPKHLEQLTKQARALTGDDDDDGEGELQGSSMEVMRKKLGRLQQRHFVLREKLTTANPLQKSLVTKLEVCSLTCNPYPEYGETRH